MSSISFKSKQTQLIDELYNSKGRCNEKKTSQRFGKTIKYKLRTIGFKTFPYITNRKLYVLAVLFCFTFYYYYNKHGTNKYVRIYSQKFGNLHFENDSFLNNSLNPLVLKHA